MMDDGMAEADESAFEFKGRRSMFLQSLPSLEGDLLQLLVRTLRTYVRCIQYCLKTQDGQYIT